MNSTLKSIVLLVALLGSSVQGFVPFPTTTSSVCSTTEVNGIFDKVGEFFEELDAFVDDATARRLGNGSKFYGKRRSNFYGEKDKDRKKDRKVADPTGRWAFENWIMKDYPIKTHEHTFILIATEDYQGPSSSGFFKWMPDENGQMRPVTRMKEKALDKPGMCDKIYGENESD